MENIFFSIIKSADEVISRGLLRILGERNSLVTFLFHSLFENSAELKKNYKDPMEETTVSDFRCFLDYFMEHNYAFVSPSNISDGLDNHGKYALITFDDGYANNLLALPILKEFNVPAIFFIASDHIKSGRTFWWDVLFRERSRRGANAQEIQDERAMLKNMTSQDIVSHLEHDFGSQAFVPLGDSDRPMTIAELKEMAHESLVTLGNHTSSHAILTNHTEQGVREEIDSCQLFIETLTGARPGVISYPNGNYSDSVVRIASELGLRLGLTVVPRKNNLPLASDYEMMRLGRFIPYGNADLNRQFELMRADFRIGKSLARKVKGGY